MTAAFMCRYPLGGGILGDTLGLEGPTDGFFRGAVFISTYSWRWFLAAWSSQGLASDVWQSGPSLGFRGPGAEREMRPQKF